jgi:hypothetical protein
MLWERVRDVGYRYDQDEPETWLGRSYKLDNILHQEKQYKSFCGYREQMTLFHLAG